MKFEKLPNSNEIPVDHLYARATEVIKRDQIDMNDFRDLYGDENIARDLQHVLTIKNNRHRRNSPQEKQSAKLADVVEAIMLEQAESNDWLGPDTEVIKTSEYDDLVNAIDGIVHFSEPGNQSSQLAFGIDITYGHFLDDKIRKIKTKIEAGNLAKIKYFKSERPDFRGEISGVPIFVIAIDKTTVKRLATLWDNREMKRLGTDQIQFQIIDEIINQAVRFQIYAEQLGQVKIAKTYAQVANKLAKIKEDKTKVLHDYQDRDRGFIELERELNRLIPIEPIN